MRSDLCPTLDHVNTNLSTTAVRAGFHFFDTVWCMRHAHDAEGEARLRERWLAMGLDRRIEVFQAVATPADPRIGVLASHRRLIEAARADGLDAILVFDEQALWHEEAATILAEATVELARQDWELCILGGYAPLTLPPLPGARRLAWAAYQTSLHAVAYGRRGFDRMLADWPADVAGLAEWVKRNDGLDAYAAGIARAFAVQPQVASLPDMLPFLAPAQQHSYTA